MRVISGSAKGRKLSAPDGLDTRPTTDRVKESVFNIINFHLPDANVLDLFAGSGAMGIEALSRASRHAVFVELNDNALKVIKKNLCDTRLDGKAEVIRADAVSYLNRTNRVFDIIFLDPPYNQGFFSPIMNEIKIRSLISDEGIIVAESEFNGELPDCDGFELVRRAKYGKTLISVFRKECEC